MPDIWYDVDANLAEVPINIFPLIDDTDFKSRETSVVYNAAGLDLVWNFTTTAGAFTQTAVTPTDTGGNYDWVNQGDGMYTIEIPASGGASINNDTEGFGWFTGVATGILPWRSPTIGFRAAALNNSLIDGTTIDVNVTAMAAGTVTASAVATGAIDADALAADAVAEIADGVWDEDATGHQTQGTFGQAIGDPVSDSDTIWGLVNTNLNATISSRASQTSLDTVDDFLDTEIAAIISTLGTPAGASISADIAAIEAQTDDIGAAGAGLTAIPWNAAWDAEVQSEVQDAIEANNLDHLIKIAVDTDFPTTVHLNSVIGHIADNGTSATYDRTTDSLEALQGQVETIDNFLDTEIAGIITTLGTPAGASISADIAAIEAQTDDIGAAGAGLTAIPWNAAWDTEVQSEVQDALEANNLDHLVGTATGIPAVPSGTYLDQIMDDGTASYDRTTDSLQAIADSGGGGPTAGQIADAVWDEALSGHLSAGSAGEALDAAGTAGDPWLTALPGSYGAGTAGKIIGDNINATISSRASQASVDTIDDFLDTEVSAILADTNELQTDWANGGRLDNILDARASQASVDTVDTVVDAILVDTGTDGVVVAASSKTGYALSAAGVQAIWDALTSALTTVGSVGKLLVDNINATISSRASQSSLDTVDDFLDTEIAAIKAKTDNLPTDPADQSAVEAAITTATSGLALQTSVDDLEGRLTAARAGYLDNLSAGPVATAASIAALNNLSAAQVNAEVVDALNVDTYAEPGQEAPPATTTLAVRLRYLYKGFRNRYTQTDSEFKLYDDAGTTVDQKATVSDAAGTFDRGEIGSGP